MSYDCGQASAAARHDNRKFSRGFPLLAEAECLLGQLGTRRLQIRLGQADRALNRPTWSPGKGQFRPLRRLSRGPHAEPARD